MLQLVSLFKDAVDLLQFVLNVVVHDPWHGYLCNERL